MGLAGFLFLGAAFAHFLLWLIVILALHWQHSNNNFYNPLPLVHSLTFMAFGFPHAFLFLTLIKLKSGPPMSYGLRTEIDWEWESGIGQQVNVVWFIFL